MSNKQKIRNALLERPMTGKEISAHTGIIANSIYPALSKMTNIKRIKKGTNSLVYSLDINNDPEIDGAAYGKLSSVKLTNAKWHHGAGR